MLQVDNLAGGYDKESVVQEQAIEKICQTQVKTQVPPELSELQSTLPPDAKGETLSFTVTLDDFTVSSDYVALRTAGPLKTMSSAVHNAGTGWYRAFVNRHVDANYDNDDAKAEMASYLKQQGFHDTDTVGMMTAVTTEHAEVECYQGDFGTVLIAVTAGVGNAVDVSQALTREREPRIGTINTWIIVNGTLADEAFIQAMITATEAKTKALQVEAIQDPLTGTIATGTSTDSLLVAATQQGKFLPYAGPITPLGKLIGHGVYDCTIRAIHAYKQAKGWTT